MNLPNKLTLARVCLIPFFVLFIELPDMPFHYAIAFLIFAIASLTDLLDGYIARKYNMVTDFGKFMDPLADKVLVTAALVYFVYLGLAPAWLVLTILAREFLVTSLRLIAASKGIVLAADKWGKYKTATSMVWICYALLMLEFMGTAPGESFMIFVWIHYFLMAVSLFFTVVSGFNYVWKNRELISQAK